MFPEAGQRAYSDKNKSGFLLFFQVLKFIHINNSLGGQQFLGNQKTPRRFSLC